MDRVLRSHQGIDIARPVFVRFHKSCLAQARRMSGGRSRGTRKASAKSSTHKGPSSNKRSIRRRVSCENAQNIRSSGSLAALVIIHVVLVSLASLAKGKAFADKNARFC